MSEFNEFETTLSKRKLYHSELDVIYEHLFKDKFSSENSATSEAKLDLEAFITSITDQNSSNPFSSLNLKPNEENLIYLLKRFNETEQKAAIHLITTSFIKNFDFINAIAKILISETTTDKKSNGEQLFQHDHFATTFFKSLYIAGDGKQYYESAIKPYVIELVDYLTPSSEKMNDHSIDPHKLDFFSTTLQKALIKLFKTIPLPYFIHSHFRLIYKNILQSNPSAQNLALGTSATYLFLQVWPSIFEEFSEDTIRQTLNKKKFTPNEQHINGLKKRLALILNEPLALLAKSLSNAPSTPALNDTEEAILWQVYFNASKKHTMPFAKNLNGLIEIGPKPPTSPTNKRPADKMVMRAQKFVTLLSQQPCLPSDTQSNPDLFLLNNAAKEKPHNIFTECQHGTKTNVEALLPAIENINAIDEHHMTALHYAVISSYEIVELLLTQPGIDVDSKDTEGRTPLMLAAQKMQHAKDVNDQSYDIVRALLLHGANPALESQEHGFPKTGATFVGPKRAIYYAGHHKHLFVCHEYLASALTELKNKEQQKSEALFTEACISDIKLAEVFLKKWTKEQSEFDFSNHQFILQKEKTKTIQSPLDDLFTCTPDDLIKIIDVQKENLGAVIDFVVEKISWLLSQPQFMGLDSQTETAPKAEEIARLKELQKYQSRFTVLINLLRPSGMIQKIQTCLHQQIMSCCESTAGGTKKHINQIKLKQVYRLHPETTKAFFWQNPSSNDNNFSTSDFEQLKAAFELLFPQPGLHKRSSIRPQSYNGANSSDILRQINHQASPSNNKTAEESSPGFKRKSTLENQISKNIAFLSGISDTASQNLTPETLKFTFNMLLELHTPNKEAKIEAASILLDSIFSEQRPFKTQNSLYMICHLDPQLFLKKLSEQIKETDTLVQFHYLTQMIDDAKRFLIEIHPNTGVSSFSSAFLKLSETCAAASRRIKQLLKSNLAKTINIGSIDSAKASAHALLAFNVEEPIKISFVQMLIKTFVPILHEKANNELIQLICRLSYQTLMNYLDETVKQTNDNIEYKKLVKILASTKKCAEAYFNNASPDEYRQLIEKVETSFRETAKTLPPEGTPLFKPFRTT